MRMTATIIIAAMSAAIVACGGGGGDSYDPETGIVVDPPKLSDFVDEVFTAERINSWCDNQTSAGWHCNVWKLGENTVLSQAESCWDEALCFRPRGAA